MCNADVMKYLARFHAVGLPNNVAISDIKRAIFIN
jgi:hypothetical protein